MILDVVEATTNPYPIKEPTPPIILDDIIDIQTMTNSLEKVINRNEYKLKTNNNYVQIFPTKLYTYKKITKHLSILNVNFHTLQLKQERAFVLSCVTSITQ